VHSHQNFYAQDRKTTPLTCGGHHVRRSKSELVCLQSEVGIADAFFSHVQAVPLVYTTESMHDAEARYELDLQQHTKFFIDYCCVRQCVKNDFTAKRLIAAITVIGVTIVELGTDFFSKSALMRSEHFVCLNSLPPSRPRASYLCAALC
jgi:hypothetical protein